jgi:hypothetical protein
VSPKGSYASSPKKHTSGSDKKNFSFDPSFRGLMEQHTDKSVKNSKKNFSGLGGLIPTKYCI